MERPAMNEASNKIDIVFLNGTKIQFQVVHVPEPEKSGMNPSGTTEDYYVIFYDNTPKLIRVAPRSPLGIQQVNLATAEGAAIWTEVEGYLNSAK